MAPYCFIVSIYGIVDQHSRYDTTHATPTLNIAVMLDCLAAFMFVWIVSAMTVTKVVEGCVYIRRRYYGTLPREGGEFELSALSPLSLRSLSRSVL